jgi:hypothetical protein
MMAVNVAGSGTASADVAEPATLVRPKFERQSSTSSSSTTLSSLPSAATLPVAPRDSCQTM